MSLKALDRAEIYRWIEAALRAQWDEKQPKVVRGLRWQYLAKMTGLSGAQIDRLVWRFREIGAVKETSYRRHRFPAKRMSGCPGQFGMRHPQLLLPMPRSRTAR